MELQITAPNKHNVRTAYFRNKGRNDTLTDVIFWNENRLVVANREVRTLYLVRINYEVNTLEVIHELETDMFFTSICKDGDVFYGVSLWNILGVFKIENLLEISLYEGLPQLRETVNWKQLFILFQSE